MQKANQRQPDAVDAILDQWARERPDLDASPMGPSGRLKRCSSILGRLIESRLEQFGLNLWEFDMLATLQRSGAPYCLSPTELFSTLMVTSGTMTHRLKSLEAKGWITCMPNKLDARSKLVQLTTKGYSLIDRAVEVHIDYERKLLSVMPSAALAKLDDHLSALLLALETPTKRRVDEGG